MTNSKRIIFAMKSAFACACVLDFQLFLLCFFFSLLAVTCRVPCHIVHLSSSSALPMIRDARQRGVPLTVETCHHYLILASEDVPPASPQFKCCPPIRERVNQVVICLCVLVVCFPILASIFSRMSMQEDLHCGCRHGQTMFMVAALTLQQCLKDPMHCENGMCNQCCWLKRKKKTT